MSHTGAIRFLTGVSGAVAIGAGAYGSHGKHSIHACAYNRYTSS